MWQAGPGTFKHEALTSSSLNTWCGCGSCMKQKDPGPGTLRPVEVSAHHNRTPSPGESPGQAVE